MSFQDVIASIETATREAAARLGLAVEVRAYEGVRSDKLGRQVRVRVKSSNKKVTWPATIKLARDLVPSYPGRVYRDKHSHYESRIGASACTVGWLDGSHAEFRVFPEPPVAASPA